MPMLREGRALGTLNVSRPEGGFTERQIQLLRTFAAQAVIAIENVRLFQELEARNRELTDALEQQTATSEILQVISRSPTDTEPVFEVIVKSASQLLGGAWTALTHVRDGALHVAAYDFPEFPAETIQRWLRTWPRPLDDESQYVSVVRTGEMINVADAQTEPDTAAVLAAVVGIMPFRGVVMMPMLKDGQSIGGILAARLTVGAFADVELALLRTFLDQAVIAIENVRLFRELEARNRELTEALERETASGRILQAIAISPTDSAPVFEVILDSALRLCRATIGGILQSDGQVVSVAAARGRAGMTEAMRAMYPRRVEDAGLAVQSIRERMTGTSEILRVISASPTDADGDQRDSARDLRVADRYPAGLRHDRAAGRPGMRRHPQRGVAVRRHPHSRRCALQYVRRGAGGVSPCVSPSADRGYPGGPVDPRGKGRP